MFQAAARALATLVSQSALDAGLLYPPLEQIRTVSESIARAVAEVAWQEGVAGAPRPPDLPAAIRTAMWDPRY